MEKPAEVDHPVHPLIQRRWSPRAFAGRKVAPQALRSLLEAARWAPSCYNEQPWFFIVATRDDTTAFERLLACLTPGNQRWAQHAAVLALSVAKLTFDRNQKPNRHALHDVGQAVANMAIQATATDLRVHQMGGFDAAKVRETYAIPAGFEPVAAIAIGYDADEAAIPESLREQERAPRTRKPLDSFVFEEKWGRVSPLLAK